MTFFSYIYSFFHIFAEVVVKIKKTYKLWHFGPFFTILLLLLLWLGVDPHSGLGLADAASLEQGCSRIQRFLRPLYVQQAVGFML